MTATVTDTTIAAAAALLADPTRAGFVVALSDGRALPAGELARRGHGAPSTATAHLAKLVEQGLLVVEAQGRHRYYRLANPAVVRALEALAAIARPAPIRSLHASEEAAALHAARTCYDHLAGALGVALTYALVDRDVLDAVADGYAVTPRGAALLEEFGLDLDDVRRRTRLFAPRCLDWSERQHHVAGALGAALAGRLFELGWIARVPATRAVRVTRDGQEGLRERFDLDLMTAPCRAGTA
jgi:DNA-binding transcriptional ArsR family regulator